MDMFTLYDHINKAKIKSPIFYDCRPGHVPLTLVLLIFFKLFLNHLKLELLTQFPASNDEKYFYLWKINISQIEIFD